MTAATPAGDAAPGAGAVSAPAADEHAACDRPSVAAGEATRVEEAMITNPKSLDLRAGAGEARRLFTNPKVLEAVLLEGESFAGLLDREALPDGLAAEAPIAPHAAPDVPTITRGRPLTEAEELMRDRGMLRLAVVEPDGHTMAGLLCLNHERTGFCQG